MRDVFQVRNLTQATVLATNLRIAQGLWERLRGLLGRQGLQDGEGLMIPHCQSVHMWGMRFPIDVVFVDPAGRVVWLRCHLRPGAMSPFVWRAQACFELPPGTLLMSHTQVGDQLSLEPVRSTR